MSKDTQKHFVENEYVSCWIENGILFQVYKNSHVDIDVAKQYVEAKIAVCDNQNYNAFIDIRNIKSATKEAREYLSGEKGIENLSAAAILAPTLISKLIGTFFITFNKPTIPLKLFTDEMDALKWLEQFKSKEV